MFRRLAAVVLLALPGCATAHSGALTGVWGGDRLVATFTEAGATLQADCADGAIAGPVHTDSSGRFSAAGAYHVLHGGPQLVEEDAHVPAPAGVRFEGRLRGDTLVLTIRASVDAAPQTFTLVRGVRPKLVRCY
jgi:hypothetical protein